MNNPSTHPDSLNLSQSHDWQIKKRLSREEADPFYNRIWLPMNGMDKIMEAMSSEQQTELLKNHGWIKIKAYDIDTKKTHDMFIQNKKSQYRLFDLPYVERKIKEGQQIGIYWSDGMLHYSIFS